MRLRTISTAAVCALALLLSTPGSASAATGQFRYTYVTDEGYEAVGFMNNPPSEECINLPFVGSNDLRPGYAPKNRTDATAVVFRDADCEGDAWFSLRPFTGGGSDRLLVRSVLFS